MNSFKATVLWIFNTVIGGLIGAGASYVLGIIWQKSVMSASGTPVGMAGGMLGPMVHLSYMPYGILAGCVCGTVMSGCTVIAQAIAIRNKS